MSTRHLFKNVGFTVVPTITSTIQLSPGQTYIAAKSNLGVRGSSGNETVIIHSGVLNAQIGGSVETIRFDSGFFNHYLLVAGGKVNVYTHARALMAQITPSGTGSYLTFSDGSSLTYTANGRSLSLTYEQLQLLPDMTLSAPNSNVTIKGATGNETVTVPANVSNVRLDASIDTIKFIGRSFDPALIYGTSGELVVKNASGQPIAAIALTRNQTDTLHFSNATGSATMNASGIGVFTLTDLYLGANQHYTPSQNNVRIYGSRGKEAVTLTDDLSGIVIDSRIDTLILPGDYADYRWKTFVGEIHFFDADNRLVAEVNLPNNVTGTQIQFADGTATASYRYGVVSLSSPNGNSSTGSAGTPASGSASTIQYTVTYGDFGVYATGVKASLEAAIGKMSTYLNAKGVLDLHILPKNTTSDVLAEASGANVRTGVGKTSPVFLLESVTGTDANKAGYDATVYVNLSNISDMNLSPSKKPGSMQFDLATIFEHELLHAIAFTGTLGTSAGATSPYDQHVSFINGNPYFIGPAAQAAFGGPVPLAPESAGSGTAYYHVDIPDDLMSSAISAGRARSISKLDLAMLQDIGAPVLVGVMTST